MVKDSVEMICKLGADASKLAQPEYLGAGCLTPGNPTDFLGSFGQNSGTAILGFVWPI
jgi:hypothetical protein